MYLFLLAAIGVRPLNWIWIKVDSDGDSPKSKTKREAIIDSNSGLLVAPFLSGFVSRHVQNVQKLKHGYE